MLRKILSGTLLASMLALLGCGDGVVVVPVEGTVKIQGKPAAGIMVQFMPDSIKGGKGPTSFATTGPDGTFKLRTNDNRDGAVVGPHMVTLSDTEEERVPQGKVATKAPRLDDKYANPMNGIKVEVKPGTPVILEVPGPVKGS